jgi:formylglycine-generating enzyme required for sulfatase activity
MYSAMMMHGGKRGITGAKCRFLLLALCCLTFAAPAFADKRIALVIGNAAYKNVTPLDNPKNDARLIADTLQSVGFNLVGGGAQLDLDKAGLDDAVQRFSKSIQGADVALFYYAGHGVQLRGSNFLVPINANPTREADIDFQMVDVALVLRQMEAAGTKLNLVMLDACRNNPFGGRGLRATTSGLGQMQAPEGTLISFATQPGNVANDGADGNSPYSRALSQIIRRPGLGIFDTFNDVGLMVKQVTGGSQQPWLSSSPIAGNFYFAGAPASTTDARFSEETAARAWAVMESTTSVAVLEDFIRQFGDTVYGSMARARLEELRRSQIAVVAPPAAPPPAPQVSAGSCGGSILTVSLTSRAAQPLSTAEECALKSKDVFKECDKCPELVVVPAGSFTMGSPSTETGRESAESPQHLVTLARPFAVARFEVTIDQFAEFVRDSGYEPASKCWANQRGKWELRTDRSWRSPGYAQAGSHPVACIGWDDAKAYATWLSRKTGKTYRLLTEAEWEYAARAGTTTRFYFGDNESAVCGYGNGADQSVKRTVPGASGWQVAPCNDGFAYTAPVGSFAPNGFGLYDMHGNVWEWIEDCGNGNYIGAPADGSAWMSGDCGSRILRGGAWPMNPSLLRLAYRYKANGDPGDAAGIRIARTLAP